MWGRGHLTHTLAPPDVVHEISKLISRSPDVETLKFTAHRRYNPENPPSFGDIFSSLASLPPSVCLKLRQIKLTGFSIAAVDFIAHSRHFKQLEFLQMLFIGDPLQTPSNMAGISLPLPRTRANIFENLQGRVCPEGIYVSINSVTRDRCEN